MTFSHVRRVWSLLLLLAIGLSPGLAAMTIPASISGYTTLTTTSYPSVSLRGYGSLSGQYREYRNNNTQNKSSLLQITTPSTTVAQFTLGKYNLDLRQNGGTTDGTILIPPANTTNAPTCVVTGQGVELAVREGSLVWILSAVNTTDLSAIMNALNMSGQTGLDFTGATPPKYLDRFDRWGWNFWYQPFEVPASQPNYDVREDFNWAQAKGVGIQPRGLYASNNDSAEGIVSIGNTTWAMELAKSKGLPTFVQLWMGSGAWLNNRYPDQMSQHMPGFLGDFYYAGAYAGGAPSRPFWVADEAADVEDAVFAKIVQKYANDDNVMGYLEPHGEVNYSGNDLFQDYGPLADAKYQQYLTEKYGTVAAVNTRWGTTYAAMTEIRVPEVASFLGWNSATGVDLTGEWKLGYEDTIAAADLTNWAADSLPGDATWPVITAPGHEKAFFTTRKAAVFRRTISLTTTQLSTLTASGTAHIYVCSQNSTGSVPLQVAVNGTVVGNRTLGSLDWGAFNVNSVLRSGSNTIALRLPNGYLGYRIYFAPTAPVLYPNLGTQKNAQWIDFREFTAWLRGKVLKRTIEAIRREDPKKFIKLMCPDGYIDVFKPLAEQYGGAFHNTGYMAAFWADTLPSVMRSSGLPFTLEPGGPATDVLGLKKMIGYYATEGVHTVDYFRNLGDIKWNTTLEPWFSQSTSQALIHQFGKYHFPQAKVAVLHSGVSRRALNYPWTVDKSNALPTDWSQWPVEGQLPYPRDIVCESDFANGNVNQYDLIFDANSSVMDSTLISQIQTWVQNGGTFVTFAHTGRYSTAGSTWPISSLTGYSVNWVDGLNPDGSTTRWQAAKQVAGQTVLTHAYFTAVNGVNANGFGMTRVDANCQNIMTWPDGSIAMGVRPLGSGYVVTAGLKFCQNRLWWDSTNVTQAWFDDLVKWRGKSVARPSASLCRVVPYVTNNGLFNHYVVWAESATVPTTTTLYIPGASSPTTMRNMLTGTTITGTVDAPNDRIVFSNIAIDKYDTLVFESPRNVMSAAPLEWFWLQRSWWKGTTTPPTAPTVKLTGDNTIDLTQSWKFSPVATDPLPMVATGYDDSGWDTLPEMGSWNYPDYPDTTWGVYRKHVTIPSNWAGRGSIYLWMAGNNPFISRPPYDFKIYLDGTQVYTSGAWKYARACLNLTTQLTAGDHVIAITSNSTLPPGGIFGEVWVEFLQNPALTQSLSGSWTPSTDALNYGSAVTLPGTPTFRTLRRTFTPDENGRGMQAFLYIKTSDSTGIDGVLINGHFVARTTNNLFGDHFTLNLTPWIKWGMSNDIELTSGSSSARNVTTVEVWYRLAPNTSNMTTWLRADAGVTLNGSTVSSWADQSGMNHTVSQATAANQPTFVANALNGKPVLRFDGSTDYLQGVAGINCRTSPYTIFVVAKPTSGIEYRWKTYLASECFRYASDNLSYKNGGNIQKTAPAVVTVQSVTRTSTGQITMYQDGVQVNTGNIATGDQEGVNFRIGGDGISRIGAADMYNGDIAEVIVYSTALTNIERQAVEYYLKTKYAIIPTTNMTMWLRADLDVTLNGSTVSNWGDGSGANHPVSQSTAANQPTYVTGAINGKPAIRFDGSNDYLQGASGLNCRTSPYTIFVVAKPTEGSSVNYRTYVASECFRYCSNNISYKNGGNISKTAPTGLTLQGVTRTSAGQITLFQNGNQLSSYTIATGDRDGVNFRIGSDGISQIGAADMFTGDIAEVIAYSTNLSDTDRKIVETYLRNKYAIY